MVGTSKRVVLVYAPPHIDPPYRRIVTVIEYLGDGDFDVREDTTGETWTVFHREIDAGYLTIEDLRLSDDDAMFEAMMGEIHLDVSDMEDIPDYKSMTKQQLMDEFIRVKDLLADAGHMFVQTTEKEKDLRTRYDAIQMEMARRRGATE